MGNVLVLLCLLLRRQRGENMKLESLEDLVRVLYASGYSQRKLAKILKVTPRTVNLWFQGKSVPSPENLVKLAKVLNVDPLELSRLFLSMKK
ncbi:helix-turn-helix domain-containing protein [Thermotoga maritima]|nr:helix-turn-helix transcriptional regulator [Thermotoga maritima]